METHGKVSFRKAKEYLRKLESQYDKDKLGLIDVKSITFDEYSVMYLNYSKANKALGSWERDITSVRACTVCYGV